MKKGVLFCVAVTVLLSTTAKAEVITVQSKDTTSEDIPLKFELEKTTWDGKKINFWGKIQNSGEGAYKRVKVYFTAKGRSGEFLGREEWYCDPDDVGKGDVCYIVDKFVRTEGRKPVVLETKVVGKRAD